MKGGLKGFVTDWLGQFWTMSQLAPGSNLTQCGTLEMLRRKPIAWDFKVAMRTVIIRNVWCIKKVIKKQAEANLSFWLFLIADKHSACKMTFDEKYGAIAKNKWLRFHHYQIAPCWKIFDDSNFRICKVWCFQITLLLWFMQYVIVLLLGVWFQMNPERTVVISGGPILEMSWSIQSQLLVSMTAILMSGDWKWIGFDYCWRISFTHRLGICFESLVSTL